jgi:hypothetical protein
MAISKKWRPNEDLEVSDVPASLAGDAQKPAGDHDAVFGEITEEGPNYRNVCCTDSWVYNLTN